MTDTATSTTTYEVTATSQLMTNHMAAKAVDAQQRFEVAEDANGEPIVFAIGTDAVLRVITVDGGSASGWQQVDVSPSVGAGTTPAALALAVDQGADGTITVAVALAATASTATSTVWVSPPIPAEPTKVDWTQVGASFVERPFPDASEGGVAVTNLLIGGAQPSGTPLLIAVVEVAGKVARYRVNADTTEATSVWDVFVFAESVNQDGIRALAVGQVFGDQGVYALSDVGANRSLVFTSIPDPQFHKTSNYEFVVDSSAATIDVTPGTGSSSDLYVGGDGIAAFLASASSATTVTSAAQTPAVTSLITRSDGTDTSIFAVSGDESLLYCHGNGSGWSDPIPLRDTTTELAALRSRTRKNNQLFFVTGDQELGYFWQDPTTSMWQQAMIPIHDAGVVVSFDSYTTRIDVTDAAGNMAPDVPISISCSQLQFITANGVSHLVGPEAPATVPTDATGTLTVITSTGSVSTGVLHLGGLGVDILDVNPAAPILTAISQLSQASDLTGATYASGPKAGQPVLAKPPDSATLDASVSAMSRLSSMAAQVPSDGSPSVPAAQWRSVHAASLAALPAPTTGTWGITFGSSVTYLEGDDAISALAALGTALEQAAGDILNWLEGVVEEVGAFFVEALEDAWRFVVKIGGQVFQMAVDTLEHIAGAINWFLKHVLGIDLSAVVQWLGFLFDWDDIKLVHRVIVTMANNTVDYAEYLLKDLASEVAGAFDWLEQKISTLEPPGHVNDHLKTKGNATESGLTGVTAAVNKATRLDPSSSWGSYHLVHGGGVDAPLPAQQASDPLTALYTDVIEPTFSSMVDTFSQIGQDVIDGFNGDMTVAEMFQAIGVDALLGVLDAIKQAVVGMIDLVADLIEMMKTAVNTVIDVPFFSALYKQISGDDLTMLDLVALLVAIPVTIGFKLATGQKPFADNAFGFDDPNYGWENAFRELGAIVDTPSAPAAPPVAMAATVTGGAGAGTGSGDQTETGGAARTYSYIGGVVYMLAGAVDDGLGVVEAKARVATFSAETSKQEEARNKIGTVTKIRFALGLIKAAGSFPVGDDEEVGLQRGVWGTYLGVGVVELIVSVAVQGLVKAEKVEVTAIEKSVQVNGVITLVETLAVFVMEAVIFGKEMETATDKTKAADILKFVQNIFYLVAHSGVGVGEAAPPEAAEVQLGAAIAALAGLAFAEIFNLVAFLENVVNEVEHQSY